MKRKLLSLTAMAALSLMSACQQCGTKTASGSKTATEDPSTVIVQLKDGTITAKEMNDAIKVELKAAQNKYTIELYDIKSQAIEKILQDRLIKQRAKAAGKTEQQLIQEEVFDKIPNPSEDEIRAFYSKIKAQDPKLPEMDDNMKIQIVDELKRPQAKAFFFTYFAKLKEEAKVEIRMDPPRFDISPSGTSKGPKDAPITLVTLSDYECPYCSKAEESVKKVLAAYPGKIRLVFNDFPLPFHKHAQNASEAAHCAEDQGKYWEMHDKLFANQRALKKEDLKQYAKDLGLDSAKFDTCLDTHVKQKMIQDSVAVGEDLGFNSTPMFFVNGVLVSGAQPFEVFKQVIDRELAKK